MVKENTHIYAAEKIFQKIKNKKIKKIIKNNKKYYFLGSIFPDCFFYNNLESKSEIIHGKNGNKTNKLIFKMLDNIKHEKDLAFIFGYITHCVLDIVFHPLIYYLSGNYYDKDYKNKIKARYTHAHLETYLDKKFNNPFYVDKLINPGLFEKLGCKYALSDYLNISIEKIKTSLKKQIKNNKFFRRKIMFYLALVLSKLSFLKKEHLGLFYENLKFEKIRLDDNIEYRNLFTGEKKTEDLNHLFKKAYFLSIKRIKSAYEYYKTGDKEKAEKIIKGKSLNTGENKAVSNIRFWKSYDKKIKK